MLNEIIELCEDFWYLVRVESVLFCHLPEQMFSHDKPEFVEPIKRSFILTMITVSVLGFMISNQDFSFQKSHMQPLTVNIHNSFLVFMKIILQKFTPEMLNYNFWARSLNQIVVSK